MKETQELDLGTMPSNDGCCPTVCEPSKPAKPSYPEFTLRNDKATAFTEAYGPCGAGDEYEMTVRVRVSGFSDDECGKRLTLCVKAIVGQVVSEEPVEDEAKEEKPKEEGGGLKRLRMNTGNAGKTGY